MNSRQEAATAGRRLAVAGCVAKPTKNPSAADMVARELPGYPTGLTTLPGGGRLVSLPEFGGELVTIRAGRATFDAPLVVITDVAGGGLPWAVIGPSTVKEPLS